MTNACAAFGSYTKVIVEGGSTPRTFDASSERLGILMETMQVIQPIQGRRRITGDLSQHSSAIRPHSYLVSGALVFQAGAADLHNWLPRVMCKTPTTAVGADTYGMGTAFDSYIFDLLITRENGVFRYTDCQVNKIVLRSRTEMGQQPQNEELLEVIVYIYGKTETLNATAWPDPEPALVLDGAYSPYAHWEGAFTVNSNATKFRSFELTIDNRLRPIWYDSITPECFRSEGRLVTMKTDNPFTTTTIADAKTLLNTGAAGSLVFTHSDDSFSTSFSFAHLRNNYKTPTTAGRGEIPLELNLEAFKTSGADELVVVNDYTATP